MNENIELDSNRAIILLPENCVYLTLSCKVVTNTGDVIEVSRTMTNSEIHKAFEDAEKNCMEDDDRFVLTEKGKQWLEEMENNSEI